jgi:hypothetical protein
MIRRDGKIQNAKSETLLGLKQPVHPPVFILCKLQKKFAFMTAVGQVPGISGYKVSIRSGHLNSVVPQKIGRGSLICLKTVFSALKSTF